MTWYLRKDDDGHWYLVPESDIVEFDTAKEQTNWEDGDFGHVYSRGDGGFVWIGAIDEFIERFDKYRLSGGVSHLKVIIEQD